MTDDHPLLFDLIQDPICQLLMERDGVKALDVLRLMRSIRPVIGRGQTKPRRSARSLAA
jgi:hypothetical protein